MSLVVVGSVAFDSIEMLSEDRLSISPWRRLCSDRSNWSA